MKDFSVKPIYLIKTGDLVLSSDNTYLKVARVVNYHHHGIIYCIPKGLIGNNKVIYCTNHPIWCNNGENRIYPSNIAKIKKVEYTGTLYNIQFEDEGTFYVNNVKVDSLSPNNKKFKLPKEMYFDKSKYTDYICKGEDDQTRKKPQMTRKYNSFVVSNVKDPNAIIKCTYKPRQPRPIKRRLV